MPDKVIDRLITGFRNFRSGMFETNRALFDSLAQGQSPKVMIISCADSRVDPLLITGAAPGDVFMVRNVANLVPPYAPDGQYHGTSAALEFAVLGLKVKHIIVLGHAQCGGVGALLNPPDTGASDFVSAWMSIAAEARDRALHAHEPQRTGEFEVIKTSLRNLKTFPWIAAPVQANQLMLHGWYYDLQQGQLLRLDDQTSEFQPV